MTLELINQITDLVIRIGGVLIGALSLMWAVNKMWLSSIYVSKAEAKQMVSENETLIKQVASNYTQMRQDLHEQKQEFAVFKERYTGDSALNSEKLTTIKETNKDILHRLNNMAQIDQKALIEEVFDDRFKMLKTMIKDEANK